MSDHLYKRSEKALAAEVGEDVVALNVERGFVFGMAGVAAEVWHQLCEPRSLADICGRLTAIYNVEPDACRQEVSEFLDNMSQEGLVEQTTANAGNGGQ